MRSMHFWYINSGTNSRNNLMTNIIRRWVRIRCKSLFSSHIATFFRNMHGGFDYEYTVMGFGNHKQIFSFSRVYLYFSFVFFC